MRHDRQRALWIGIPLLSVLAAILLYQYGYLKMRAEVMTLVEAQGQKTRTLQKQISLISRKDAFEKERVALIENRKAEEGKLTPATTLALAGESVRQTARSTLTSKGGTILSEKIEKVESIGKFTTLGVTLELVYPDIKVFLDSITALEGTPTMAIKDIDIRIKDHNDPRDLVVRLKIAGLTGAK